MKLAFLTGSRSEWGLLERLYSILSAKVDTEIYATGSHLSTEHGLTIDQIKFPVKERIEIVLSGVTSSAISKSIGLAMIGFSDVFQRNKPDWVLGLGDRYELFAAMTAAYVAGIPIIHLHGGEETKGSLDNAFRHSISHMATLHFVAAAPYASKLTQLGIQSNKVFSVGAPGCDGLTKRREQPGNKRFVVCWYGSQGTLRRILDELNRIGAEHFTLINGSHDVGQEQKFNGWIGTREEFLREVYQSDAIIGNSSSGIIEAPAMGVPTINIGNRQEGRLRAGSIIDCETGSKGIREALVRLYSEEFQATMRKEYHLYYRGGNVAERIAETILSEVRNA